MNTDKFVKCREISVMQIKATYLLSVCIRVKSVLIGPLYLRQI